jgi:hypothetical protein
MIVFDGLCRSTPAVPAWAPPRPAQVAECAGHPVDLLRKIYAKTLDGPEEMARRRVTEAPGHRLSRSRTHRDPTYALSQATG